MLQLVIVSPSGVVSRTAVEKVSFPGEMGAFTVLQDHAPLVSGLVRGEIVYAAAKGGSESSADSSRSAATKLKRALK